MWAVWGNATAFLITISAAIIRVSACSWTRLSLPQVGGSISQSSFPRIVTFPFIHCVPCQPSQVLVAPRLLFSGTSEGTWLVLGQRGPPGTLSSKKGLVSISISGCCLHVSRKVLEMECLLHCVQARGCRETRGPHWVGQSRPLPLCLRIAPGWTPLGQRGEQTPGLPQVPWAGQPIWALPQDPHLCPHLPRPQAFPQSSLCRHLSPWKP